MNRNKKLVKLLLYSATYIAFSGRKRRYWVHPINLQRDHYGEYKTLCLEIEKYPEKYHQYFRMSKKKFDKLLKYIKPHIELKLTNFRKPIEAKLKLVLTLRFLATGSSFSDLSLRFRMGRSTVENCIKSTLRAIIAVMMPLAIPKQTKESWLEISKGFLEKWNFPNCLGAIDGKHCSTFAPRKSGSLYFSYKRSFSTVLMAAVDADYKFIMIDVGAYGANHDSTIFYNSDFGHAWLNRDPVLQVPESSPLPGQNTPIPFFMVADEAFGLKPNVMTPFPGQNLTRAKRLYNYRHCRARRVVENAFGIMAHTWRILLTKINTQPETINNIIIVSCILHNFLRVNASTNAEISSESETEPGIPQHMSTSVAYDIRTKIQDWCLSEGNVDFQHNMI